MAQQPLPSHLRGAVDLSALRARHSAPTAPVHSADSQGSSKGAAPGSPSVVVEASDANFSAILELSAKVPVIVEVYAGSPTSSLVSLVEELAGRFVLATVDSAANPQLVAALQVAVAPTVVAIIAGRPAPLYEGELPVEQAREVLEQVSQLAAQNGVSGSVDVSAEGVASTAEQAEEPLPPLHQEAFDAISAGDFDAAIAAYKAALAQSPRDALATAGLAQVSLLKRVSGLDAPAVRAAAADSPANIEAQLQVADLDVAGGHVEDAFDRLLELFGASDAVARDAVRVRLLELFEIVGAQDERVVVARRRLTSLMF
ncbi:MAG TPA: tetratricopeptide repeat protein [Terrimesophilobacter sp.]|nr:tetratricopeptide repeat protein [Terrimesophilobacter sp.]